VSGSYAFDMQATQFLILLMVACLGPAVACGQPDKPTSAAKSTTANPKKVTKAIPPVTFDAHSEGSVEGSIYGNENLVSITIDSAGLHYQGKSQDKPVAIKWDELSGWQPNNFTSRSPSRTSTTDGDYGIGIYVGTRYFSFRTRSGRDYMAAVKALRAVASAKERPGIG
jgi:hypothetical protein